VPATAGAWPVDVRLSCGTCSPALRCWCLRGSWLGQVWRSSVVGGSGAVMSLKLGPHPGSSTAELESCQVWAGGGLCVIRGCRCRLPMSRCLSCVVAARTTRIFGWRILSRGSSVSRLSTLLKRVSSRCSREAAGRRRHGARQPCRGVEHADPGWPNRRGARPIQRPVSPLDGAGRPPRLPLRRSPTRGQASPRSWPQNWRTSWRPT
jgi:hypothetical protein